MRAIVSNHRQHVYLLNRLATTNIQKLRITGPLRPMGFPHKGSANYNPVSVSMRWRHHVYMRDIPHNQLSPYDCLHCRRLGCKSWNIFNNHLAIVYQIRSTLQNSRRNFFGDTGNTSFPLRHYDVIWGKVNLLEIRVRTAISELITRRSSRPNHNGLDVSSMTRMSSRWPSDRQEAEVNKSGPLVRLSNWRRPCNYRYDLWPLVDIK